MAVSAIVLSIVLVSCSQQLPLTPTPEVLPANMVCNHNFSDSQRNLKPSFVERESNSIIGGDSSRDLLRSLTTTTEYQGKGNTQWTISWSFDSRRSAVGCTVQNVETSVEVDYHLPLWPEQLTVSNRTLANQWTQYSDTLRAHHCKHGRVGIDASLEVKSRLQRMAPIDSCDALIQEADSLAKSVISVYKQFEAGFTPPQILDYLQR